LGELARGDPAALLVIGLGSSITYLLVLFAYQMGPVGYIVAAREAAVVVGVVLGVVVLKEPFSAAKGAAVAAIVLGLLCIRAG
jgi:drug/metabolite transporter (DMT)-like permease